MAVNRRQHPGAPRNPFMEGGNGRDVSYGDDSCYGPQKYPFKRFIFKLISSAFAVFMIIHGMYSWTVAQQSEVSETVSFNIKAASAGNSKSFFESPAKKVIPSESEEGGYPRKEQREYDDLTKSQEDETEEKESGDGVDENAVDEKPWIDAVKGDSEAESVDDKEQQKDEQKDANGDVKGVGEPTPDKKIEDSAEEKVDKAKGQLGNKVIKNSDDKEDKVDEYSTKIAGDEAEPDKTMVVANEKIHAEEKLAKSANDEKERRQGKPLSDAGKDDTKAESIDKEKKQEDEPKDTKEDKNSTDEVKPDKKVEDSPQKRTDITKTKVDDKEMKKSDDRQNNEDKDFTKIADDEIKSNKNVEAARDKTRAEEKLSKPSSQVDRIAKSAKDVETKLGDAKDRNDSINKVVGTGKADEPVPTNGADVGPTPCGVNTTNEALHAYWDSIQRWSELDAVVAKYREVAKISGGIFLFRRQSFILTSIIRKLVSERIKGDTQKLRVCETGFGAGHSAALFLSAFENEVEVVTFDRFDREYQIPALEKLRSMLPNVRHIVGDTCITVPAFFANETERPCDFVHGSSFCRSDMIDLVRHMKTGGIVTATAMQTLNEQSVYFGERAQWRNLRNRGCIANIHCWKEEPLELTDSFVFAGKGMIVAAEFCVATSTGNCTSSDNSFQGLGRKEIDLDDICSASSRVEVPV